MAVSFDKKDRYTMEDLLQIMALLRSPMGCPWDREQTHQSIRTDFLEETHEVIEAINQEDTAGLQEELGDVLLQIVFHSQIEGEKGTFQFGDVVDGICKKLIIHHPHVFGEVIVDSSGQVLQNWDAIKRKTKGNKTQRELLEAVPRSLPALMRAAKVQNRARRVGFDWPEVSGALDAMDSEMAEFREALASANSAAVEEERGDLLFSVVNVSRFTKTDAEQALTGATDKFIRRFAEVEHLAAERKINMSDAGLETLDELWREAKAKVRGASK